PAVVEHAEETVEPHIDTRRLHHRRIERVHSESPGLERLTKLTVTQQHHPTLTGPYAASSGGGLGPYPHVPRIGGVVPHRLAEQLGVAAPSELPESLLYPCRAGQTLPHGLDDEVARRHREDGELHDRIVGQAEEIRIGLTEHEAADRTVHPHGQLAEHGTERTTPFPTRLRVG